MFELSYSIRYSIHMVEEYHHTPNAPEILVVLGKNIGVGQLYQKGMKIIFSTGKTAGGDLPSEAESMKRYFQIHFDTYGFFFIKLQNRQEDKYQFLIPFSSHTAN